jgi:alpha-L-arabinofuranosidase
MVANAPAARAKTAPPLPKESKPWEFVGGSKVDIKVDLSKELAPVTSYHFGNNVAWYDSKDWFKRQANVDRATSSGIRFWRWPGGSSSDNYHWDGDYSSHPKDHEGGDPSNMSKSWAVSSDDFIEFCRATGSEAIVTVNYAAARYSSVEKAADLAARWVHYFNVEKKLKVRYWEIGNEVHGPWEEGNKVPGKPQLTGEIYGKDFNVFAQAMPKVDPDILIGAVAVDADSGDDWSGYRWWMHDMLPLVADSADFLIEHNYFMWPFEGDKFISPSTDKLFENVAKIGKAKSDIDAMVAKYTIARHRFRS